MAGEAAREGPELDPVMRAAAETRAEQAGLSLGDYLTRLIQTPVPSWPTTVAGPAPSSLATGVAREWGTWLHAHAPARDERVWQHHVFTDLMTKSAGAESQEQGTSAVLVSPALQLVVMFNSRMNDAAFLMSAAFHEAAVSDFNPSTRQGSRSKQRSHPSWFEASVRTCLDRSRVVRNALVHHWTPTPRAEHLAIKAFVLLTDLTPAGAELLQLCRQDRPRAFSQLAKYLDLVTDQFSLSANLLAEVEAARPAALADDRRFAAVAAALLDRAGGGVTLTEGAALLGVRRQALHKRVKAGSALGIMHGNKLVLPRMQFVAEEGRTRLLPGLAKVVRLFEEAKAGGWSALQFLIELDPNLSGTPRDALTQGRVESVVNAARAYLGLDEG